MMKFLKENKIGFLIYFFGIFTLFVSFYFGLDGYGSALSGDFRDTWPYVLKLKENFFINPSQWTLHFPFHYYFLSKLDLVFNNTIYVRFIVCLISILTPCIFYQCLKFKYPNQNLENLLILSSIILFTPSFIYSAVWANDNVSSYIFLLLGVFFFFKSENIRKNIHQENFYTYITLFFLALTCYSRQYYSIFYGFFMIYYFRELKFRRFFLTACFSLALALPGMIFLYLYPEMFKNLAFSGNISNTFLGNVTSMFIYTLPIFLINFFYFEKNLFDLKKIFFYMAIASVISIFVFFTFNINTMGQNGGAIFILSNKIFGSYYFFYIIFFVNLVLILILFNKPIDLFFIFSLVFMISGIIVLQKYFEPLFYIFFFLFSKSLFKDIFFVNKKAASLLVLYHLFYFFLTTSNLLHTIKFI